MKLGRFFAIATLLVAATAPAMAGSGPAFSLQGLFSDDDCEAAPEILGDWTGNTDLVLGGTWTLQKLGDRKYRMVRQAEESDNGIRPAFDICAAHLGGYLFFDATFQELRTDGKEVLGSDESGFWIPVHLIGRLDIEMNALHFRLLDDDWLRNAWKSERVHLARVQDDDAACILAAPSKELKEFVTSFATDPEAFSFEESFERAPAQHDAEMA
jgi:hypothetical protein